jgi:phosphopentomutase
VATYSIGKIIDLFAGIGFTQYRRTKNNAEGLSQLLSLLSAGIENSFTFVNLIDTDQNYGHRQDPVGYARCLEEIDRALPAVIDKLNEGDLLILTGDHGNDPADDSTDHTREFVPLLVIKKGESNCQSLGIRNSFSDVAKTILHSHSVENELQGASFYDEL